MSLKFVNDRNSSISTPRSQHVLELRGWEEHWKGAKPERTLAGRERAKHAIQNAFKSWDCGHFAIPTSPVKLNLTGRFSIIPSRCTQWLRPSQTWMWTSKIGRFPPYRVEERHRREWWGSVPMETLMRISANVNLHLEFMEYEGFIRNPRMGVGTRPHGRSWYASAWIRGQAK